jgi:hypothetical protein
VCACPHAPTLFGSARSTVRALTLGVRYGG